FWCKGNNDFARGESCAGVWCGAFLRVRGVQQSDGLRFELPAYTACADDGFDFSRESRDVAGDELAGVSYRFLLVDHRLGVRDDDSVLVGRIAAGEMFEGRCECVSRRQKYGDC